MASNKLLDILTLVIDHYIGRWDPVWSKFLNSLESIDYAPSTLRKYLNMLEQEWLLYQPYNSAWRIPTPKWLSNYLEWLLDDYDLWESWFEDDLADMDIKTARNDLRSVTELVWEWVDGAAVWFLREDEYYYLGINNLLKETFLPDVETTRYLIKFIESKEIVTLLTKNLIQSWKVYYRFVESEEKVISIVYTKIDVNGFDAIVAVLWPSRVDHKRNIAILHKLIQANGKRLWLEYDTNLDIDSDLQN